MRLAVLFTVAVIASCEAADTALLQEAPPSARPNLYQCDGCEAVYERDAAVLSNRAVLAAASEPGERMVIEGTVYQTDGVTPAGGIVLYFWHTNAEGLYANGSDESAFSREHGRLRGWLKTGTDGRYTVETVKPAPYPDDSMPAHVHPVVLEAGRRPYYIDDIVFDGEFGVTPAYRKAAENRGGNGIVAPSREGGVWRAERDIILEVHP